MSDELITQLADALRGIAKMPGYCFCGHGIGHPLMPSHSTSCDNARKALKDADAYLSDNKQP